MVSQKQLIAELSEHNDFFDMIVDMIPSKLYIAGESGDDYNPKNPYYHHQGSKQDRKAAAKAAKRQKLDPNQSESTVEKKERLEKSAKVPMPSPENPTASQETADTSSPHQSRIEALKAKLHAKIASKQSQRPKLNPDQVSKRAARRAEKRKRQEEAARNKKKATSRVDGKTSAYKISSSIDDPSRDLGSLDFGRLSGLNQQSRENYAETNKSLANLSKSKNLKKMLADAEAKRLKLQELKKGSHEDQAKAAQMQWTDTFKEADGQRVKDDPAKLKKSLKRKAAKKTKSQKAWKSRMEQKSHAQEERQQIRQHNLSARKQGGAVGANLSKKKIKTTDQTDGGRRLSRAGFEGKKREFLNSPKD